MAIKARRFERTFILTKTGIDQRGYIEQFVSAALAAKPNRIYSNEYEISPGEYLPGAHYFIEKILADSRRGSTIPLVPAGTDPPARFEDLSPEIKRGYEIYPLVEGESIISLNMLCLMDNWEDLHRGMVFVGRETNWSRAYFAVSGWSSAPHTQGVTPALLLLRIPSLRFSKLRLTTALTPPSRRNSGSLASRFSDLSLTR